MTGLCWEEENGVFCLLKKGHKRKHQFAPIRMSPAAKNLVNAGIRAEHKNKKG